MTWIKLAQPPKPVHSCVLPEIAPEINEGSIWQCDGCPKQWEVRVYDDVDVDKGVVAPIKYFDEVIPKLRDPF